MLQISGDNFTIIYFELLKKAFESKDGFIESRSGKVKDLGPAFIEIAEDKFRLPVLPYRAINPFFAFAEFSWFITGSNRVEPLRYFIITYGR